MADDPAYHNPIQASQVLLNILTNAKDAFISRDIAAPKIVIRVGTEGEKSVVTITDGAGGIPEDIIDKIFDPYFTTKGPEQGTGVGLFMCKTIRKEHGRRPQRAQHGRRRGIQDQGVSGPALFA